MPVIPSAREGTSPELVDHTRLFGAQLPARGSLDVFASRDDHASHLTVVYIRTYVPARGFGAAAKKRSGEAGIFGAFLFGNWSKVVVACSAVKNHMDSQISIPGKPLTLSEKTLFEQNASGKCQNCEYLTLLTTFARDKCCD